MRGGGVALLALELAQEEQDIRIARVLPRHLFADALRFLAIAGAQRRGDLRVQFLHVGRQLLDACAQRLVLGL
ncbi:hypothetical protein D3C87_1985040 [compost metagenome]